MDYRAPMPRPKVRGVTIDFHCHLFAARHAPDWFAAADHYGLDCFVTMTPLEEATVLQREHGDRVQFIAVPKWQEFNVDDWLRRIEAFYNMGSRIIKIHAAPQTMAARGYTLESPEIQRVLKEAVDRKMVIMTHLGDPDTWYESKYTDHAKFGTRDEHYRMWERVLEQFRGHPWVGAHLGGNPENLTRLQHLLDTYPDLMLDISATRWMVREVSLRRDAAREFVIRNQSRLIFGSDQVSGDDRGFDFLASRFWAHRKLWETAYIGPTPIYDPDVPADKQPILRGLALPDQTIQRLYHDNAIELLAKANMSFPGWG
ncbi:MAG TPA: amidohydrolase family protein [Tepidisphaeraceae bacterium]|nr:amidohydrolase family protein [Tepidisphaeraceae bacterium]